MCEQCGYEASRYGREGTCADALTELSYYTLVQPRPPFIHQLAVDAAAAQHLHDGLTKIQRLFGLMGLFMVCEMGATGLEVQRAHQRKSMDANRAEWPLLEIRPVKFTMNVGDVLVAEPGEERDAAIHRWVRETWAAYEYAHDVIRAFCGSEA